MKKVIVILQLLIVSGSAMAQTPITMPAPYSSNVPRSYVRTWDATSPHTDPNTLASQALRDVKQTTQYVDGLGRPIQTVVKQGSYPTGGSAVDFVTANVYDDYGREMYQFLPFAANNTGGNTSISDGAFKLNPFQQDSTFNKNTFTGETFYYSQTLFEPSPLGRPQKVMAPGNNWVGASRGVESKYWFNTSTDSVRIWNVTDVANSFGTYASGGFYAANTLFKNVMVDEHGKQVIEFKDKQEKVILKKVQLTAAVDTGTGKGYHGWLCTYYIYDDLSQLRAVVQPVGTQLLIAGSWSFSSDILNEQSFRYEYDQRGRMIMKKVPGAGIAYMIFDARDRLVMTQDSLQRAAHQWLYTQYDEQNRPVATGLITDNTYYNNAAYHRGQAAASTAYPNVGIYTNEELTKTFYDNYAWLSSHGNPFSATRITGHDGHFMTASNTTYPYPQSLAQSSQTTGLVTGTRVKMLGTSQYLYGIIYYDNESRVLQTITQNITGQYDLIQTQYDFNGKVLIHFLESIKNVPSLARYDFVRTNFEYDDLGRVSGIKKTPYAFFTSTQVWAGGNEMKIVANEYNALGQLKNKKLSPDYNSGAGLETANYEYNIRGWMLGMNRDYVKDVGSNYFGFELAYDKTTNIISGQSYTGAQYNGNISGTTWKSKGDLEKRKYDFTYDAANRLLSADFNQYTSSSFSKSAGVDFSLSNMSYDPNGNIRSMKHRGLKLAGSSTIDSLSYNYITNSNKLLNVIDGVNDAQTKLGDFRTSTLHPASGSKGSSTADYEYDANGNMVKDLNKDIVTYAGTNGIVYNHLNLPQTIHVRKSNGDKGRIEYLYDASGNKLKKTVFEPGVDTTITLYIAGSVYKNDTFQFMSHEEGRLRLERTNPATCTPQSDRFVFDYFIKDHLGNVRMVLTDQQDDICYLPATVENASWQTEDQIYDIVDGRRIDKATTGASGGLFGNKLYRVHGGNTGEKTGLGMVLKVMSGDQVKITAESYYTMPGGGAGSPLTLGLTELLTVFAGGGPVAAAHGTVSTGTVSGIGANTTNLNNFIGNTTAPSNTAEAFLNWILFDDQLKFVAANAEPVNTAGGYKQHIAFINSPVNVTKNGFLYIYVSNESNFPVFFDNLAVTHIPGAIVEETHYYPFGLIMEGISSKALAFTKPQNIYKFNSGTELSNKEFSDGSGLEIYETPFRGYDAQLGRFWQIDLLSDNFEDLSPYGFGLNNPLLFNDPSGLKSDPSEISTPQNPKVLEEITLVSSQRNRYDYTDWSRFVDLNKHHNQVSLNNFLIRQGVDERGLRLFNLAWSNIGYRERKAEIDHAMWKLEEMIAKGVVSLIGGRIFIKLGLKYIPLAKLNSLVLNNSLMVRYYLSLAYNNIRKEVYLALAGSLKYIPENMGQIQHYLNEAAKFVNINAKDIKMIYETFEMVKKVMKNQ